MGSPHSPIRTQGELLRYAIEQLEAAGIPEPRRTAEWLVEHLLKQDRSTLYAFPERPITSEQKAQLDRWLARRKAHEPVQYITQETSFMGLPLRVTPAVLIPRPETEELVSHALSLNFPHHASVLDIGTGSGCIALALKHFRPDIQMVACDISPEALKLAQQNAERLKLPIQWVLADVLHPQFPTHFESRFHGIISNPPYIPIEERPSLQPEVADYEPEIALFTSENPLEFYQAISQHTPSLLHPGGIVLVEVHPSFAHKVAELFRQQGFTHVTIIPDLAKHPRMVEARWNPPQNK